MVRQTNPKGYIVVSDGYWRRFIKSVTNITIADPIYFNQKTISNAVHQTYL